MSDMPAQSLPENQDPANRYHLMPGGVRVEVSVDSDAAEE
jgi:hypothetical protein